MVLTKPLFGLYSQGGFVKLDHLGVWGKKEKRKSKNRKRNSKQEESF
jgi:hypothetical protein